MSTQTPNNLKAYFLGLANYMGSALLMARPDVNVRDDGAEKLQQEYRKAMLAAHGCMVGKYSTPLGFAVAAIALEQRARMTTAGQVSVKALWEELQARMADLFGLQGDSVHVDLKDIDHVNHFDRNTRHGLDCFGQVTYQAFTDPEIAAPTLYAQLSFRTHMAHAHRVRGAIEGPQELNFTPTDMMSGMCFCYLSFEGRKQDLEKAVSAMDAWRDQVRERHQEEWLAMPLGKSFISRIEFDA